MSNKQILSLAGEDSNSLPQFVVRFSDDTNRFCNSFQDAINQATDLKLSIKSFAPADVNKNIYSDSEGFVYDMQNILNSFLYAIHGHENFNENYSIKFFAFLEHINTMEKKIQEMKRTFQSNYEIISAGEGLESKKVC